MKECIGTCVDNPFGRELDSIVDRARPLAKRRFLAECDLPDEIKAQMKRYPNDYRYSQTGDIWFYE